MEHVPRVLTIHTPIIVVSYVKLPRQFQWLRQTRPGPHSPPPGLAYLDTHTHTHD